MTHLPVEEPRLIYTNNPEQEIWNSIGDLSSERFCHDFMKERIKRKNSWKMANLIFKKKKGLKNVEFFRPITKEDMM